MLRDGVEVGRLDRSRRAYLRHGSWTHPLTQVIDNLFHRRRSGTREQEQILWSFSGSREDYQVLGQKLRLVSYQCGVKINGLTNWTRTFPADECNLARL